MVMTTTGGLERACDYPVAWAKAVVVVGIMAWAVAADLEAFGKTIREVMAAATDADAVQVWEARAKRFS